MQTFLTLEHDRETDIPAEYDDVRTPEAYVRHFLREFSESGDTVFDPFAGFGTTLTVAEELGRVPYGVEYEEDRVELVRDRIDRPENVRRASALDLDFDRFPAFDCCLTSPPYMERSMAVNPFRNYAAESESDYEAYLADLTDLFARLADHAAADATVLVDISNMKHEERVTTLAWDVADAVSESLRFEGEVVVGWEGEEQTERDGGTYGYGYDHSYCLVFRADGTE
ncbi:DNA methyltransferase [Halorussus aquaticus]|uniref:Type II methyltransferase n=1 Tax=Halorussus aquaticus TaxID=2953748 RepID=A0ABD5Q3Z4_9EURY|nr:DNA methyltransferase [Halorussus aquaticus]